LNSLGDKLSIQPSCILFQRIEEKLQYKFGHNGHVEDEVLAWEAEEQKRLPAKEIPLKTLPKVDVDGVQLHLVRSVAPGKHMYCASFRVPKEVAFAPRT
jgi:hypothetical protein